MFNFGSSIFGPDIADYGARPNVRFCEHSVSDYLTLNTSDTCPTSLLNSLLVVQKTAPPKHGEKKWGVTKQGDFWF